MRALTIASPVVRALTIASSDSGGGAGIQADLKAFARCGVHGTSAIVALTAQNTTGVTAIHECPPDFVVAQLVAVLDDLAPAAAKTGMLFSTLVIEAVAGVLEARVAAGRRLPLVIDPVMVASSGARLLRDDAVAALTGRLFPLATVVTPNLLEAQALTGLATEDRVVLTEALVALGAPAALVTGGPRRHGPDHLFAAGRHVDIAVPRYDVAATHGAGAPIRPRWPRAWPVGTTSRGPLGGLRPSPPMQCFTGWWARLPATDLSMPSTCATSLPPTRSEPLHPAASPPLVTSA